MKLSFNFRSLLKKGLVVVALAASMVFVSCKANCDLCGEKANLKKVKQSGVTVKLCQDCIDDLDSVNDAVDAYADALNGLF